MFKFEFDAPETYKHHTCKASRNGDWITFYCPECNYERRENWRTGEFKIRNSQPNINHSGSYFPIAYKESFENIN